MWANICRINPSWEIMVDPHAFSWNHNHAYNHVLWKNTDATPSRWLLTIWLATLPAVRMPSLITMFMGPTWGPTGADRTQVGPMLAPWTLLSGVPLLANCLSHTYASEHHFHMNKTSTSAASVRMDGVWIKILVCDTSVQWYREYCLIFWYGFQLTTYNIHMCI